MTRRRTTTAALLALVATLGGCAGDGGQQSALRPGSGEASAIGGLWQTMLVIGTAVWLFVSVVAVIAVVRRRREREHDVDREREGRRTTLWVAVAGAIVPAVILAVVLVQSVVVLRDNADGESVAAAGSGGGSDQAAVVEITGHQFWWEIKYPEAGVETANEIHIPAGEQVELQLSSADVIHSFWVPELGGKVDLVPGRSNTMRVTADEPGTYWGQCAEYCGIQHAKMRIVVVAHEPAEYQAWLQAQSEPAEMLAQPGDASTGDQTGGDQTATSGEDDSGQDVGPSAAEEADSEMVARGQEVFLSSSCVYCHTVAGTPAQGNVGPDLTHLASRQTLASGVLQNTTGNLAGWITDPQSIKPGNLMPATDLEGEDLQALLAYLESLE
ncbi:c-type cytochrome [Georgenia halophila]|uniref:cytochrome-c oxidase n=1 Tax=Georgenia halophila TaxID=620889 RepID=A0ABP8LLY1_9MICO